MLTEYSNDTEVSEQEGMPGVDQAIDYFLHSRRYALTLDPEAGATRQHFEQLVLSKGREVLPYLQDRLLDDDRGGFVFAQFVSDLATTEDLDMVLETIEDQRVLRYGDQSAMSILLTKLEVLTQELRLANNQDALKAVSQRMIAIYPELNGYKQSRALDVIAMSGTSEGRDFVLEHMPRGQSITIDELSRRIEEPSSVSVYIRPEFRRQTQNNGSDTPTDPLVGRGGAVDRMRSAALDNSHLQPIDPETRALLLKLLKVDSRGTTVEKTGHEIFKFEEEQRELFQYCSEVTRFLHDNGIADLVIIDRSSRPLYVGVRECWRAYYPEEPMPGIYFLNPKGFKPTDEMTSEEFERKILDCYVKGDNTDLPKDQRGVTQIDAEFAKVYQRLLADKEKPILVFDSCIHSGGSLQPVKESMLRLGFSNVLIGSINPADSHSTVQTDYFITHERPEKGCYPFDRDRIIEKTFDHVFSSRTTEPEKREAARKLRDEIRSIIRERLESDKVETFGDAPQIDTAFAIRIE